MNQVDVLPIVLIVGYMVLGYYTGVLRRLIGLVALYVAFLAATNMGLQAGGILQQSSNFETPDARIFGFFGIGIAVLLIIEGAAQLAHSQIKLEAIVLDRLFGLALGLITGVVLSVVVIYELQAAANPFGGSQLDPNQQRIRDAVNGSHFAVSIVGKIDKPIIELFQPVLPGDPQIYFGPGPVNP